MAIGLRLRRGARILDLNSGRYAAGDQVTPPPARYSVQLSEGTASNRSGGRLIGKKPQNRTWTFEVVITTKQTAEIVQAISDLQTMLNMSGDEAEPLLIEYRSNTSVPPPLWDQFGAWRAYEVVHGSLTLTRTASLPWEALAALTITCEINPYALGQRQRLMSAAGGIIEDTLGVANGASRGLIVPGATTNKMTNPIFGHATWNDGWTAQSALTATRNTDLSFVLFGDWSARVASSANSNNLFHQSINVGNTNGHVVSCYARKPDGSAVTEVDCRLYYNATLTTTFTAAGNGWYRLTASVTGINAATNTGIVVPAGATIYADGFQIEEQAYATRLCFGDLPGGAWTGTAHASSSTRTAGACKISIEDDVLRLNTWTIRIVIKTFHANTYASDWMIFDARDGSHTEAPRMYFEAASDSFVAAYSSQSSASTAQTFAGGTTFVLHMVCEGGAIVRLYVNGVACTPSAKIAPASYGAALHVGADYAGANHGQQVTLNLATFERDLTASEISADYADLAAALQNDGRIDGIPWLWTQDGDNVLDNCDDSTHDNKAIAGGIPGTAAAETEFRITNSPDISGHYLTLSTYPYEELMYGLRSAGFYTDLQGTGSADASGGEIEPLNVSGYMPNLITFIDAARLYDDRTIHFLLRAKRSVGAATQAVRPAVRINGVRDILGDSVSLAFATSFRIFYLGHMRLRFPSFLERSDIKLQYMTFQSPIGNTWDGDYLCAIPGQLLYYSHNAADTGTNTTTYIRSREALAIYSAALYTVSLYGDVIELRPNAANHLMHFTGDRSGSGLITDTATFVVYVTPRYELL